MSKTTISPAKNGLVSSIMVTPPAKSTRLRKDKEILVPTRVCTSVVSAVSRDKTSPVCRVSK